MYKNLGRPCKKIQLVQFLITAGTTLDMNQSHDHIRWFKTNEIKEDFQNPTFPPFPCNYHELQFRVVV